MEIKNLGILLTIFITIIIAVTLIQTISIGLTEADTTSRSINETYTIATADKGEFQQLNNMHIITDSESVTNATDGTAITTYTLQNVLGKISFAEEGTFNLTYEYYPEGYIQDRSSKRLVGLIPLLMAVGVLLFVGFGTIKKYF